MPLVAVDQVNHSLANVMIHSHLNLPGSGLGEGQLTQMTNNACTDLNFSICSPQCYEQLILYAEGPCRNSSMSQLRVNVTFQPCTCPIGFESKNNPMNCECVCDSELRPYIADTSCDYQAKSLIRKGNFWITFINSSSTDNSSGYLIYPHCPLDYCLPPYLNVQINLNTNKGADAQCANNRSGILCGVCQPGLSLSLGSSHCIQCPKDWYRWFIAIVIGSLLAGIVLVTLLMVLNLTVAVGMLN